MVAQVYDDMAQSLSSASETKKEHPIALTILHLGDVFLDGPVPRLRRDTKEHRREELREAFSAFMARVDAEMADLVVFSGNLLDGKYAGDGTLKFLLRAFESRPHCHFIIAPGPADPYDERSVYHSKRLPRNVHIFLEETLGTYNFPELPLTVYGWGYRSERYSYSPLSGAHRVPSDRFTVLCGYARPDGEEAGAFAPDEAAIADFGAHYTALSGSVHDGFHRAGDGIYAYSGTFEGRDGVAAAEQSGGYIRVRATETDGGWAVDAKRMPLSTYSYATERLDVSHLAGTEEAKGPLLARIREGGYGSKTVLRVILCGAVPLDASFEGLDAVEHGLYSLWIEDRTVPTDTDGSLLQQMNAKGELYRHFYPQMTEGAEEDRVRAARAFRIAYAALLGEDFAKY